MGGIFGLIDPEGIDRNRLAAGVRTAPRGEPHLWCEGPYALGHYREPRQWSSLHVTPEAVTAVDGRIDAALPGTESARLSPEHRGHSLLRAALAARGGEALKDLAADFAVARLDQSTGSLLLSRDAFGMRPLFWARRGDRFGFASDADVLVALGLADGELDHDVISAYLSGSDIAGERTGFVGVRRFPGGSWMERDSTGGVSLRRWFRPEDVPEQAWTLHDAAEAVDEALQAAVADRCRGRRSALLLSGGRDSGAVAVAAARSGEPVACLTKAFEPEWDCSEETAARQLATALGLGWRSALMPTTPSQADLDQLPALSGTPLALPSVAEVTAVRRAVADLAPATVMDGEGGDVLFMVGPVAVCDYLRRGRAVAALQAARAFPRFGWYPPLELAKSVARSLAPPRLVRARDGARRGPPWVLGRPALAGSWKAPLRSARQHLLQSVAGYSLDPNAELWDRLLAGIGSRFASPLLDQRVVRIALSLPLELRVPSSGPKPVLATAFLGPFDATRRKASFYEYYVASARALQDAFPSWFGSSMLSSREGFIDGQVLERAVPAQREADLLRCVGLEAWLRTGPSRNRRET